MVFDSGESTPEWARSDDWRRVNRTCPVCMAPVYEKSSKLDDYVEQRCANYENGCQQFADEEDTDDEEDAEEDPFPYDL